MVCWVCSFPSFCFYFYLLPSLSEDDNSNFQCLQCRINWRPNLFHHKDPSTTNQFIDLPYFFLSFFVQLHFSETFFMQTLIASFILHKIIINLNASNPQCSMIQLGTGFMDCLIGFDYIEFLKISQTLVQLPHQPCFMRDIEK